MTESKVAVKSRWLTSSRKPKVPAKPMEIGNLIGPSDDPSISSYHELDLALNSEELSLFDEGAKAEKRPKSNAYLH